ncbi:hypothetical protein EJB05_41483 [Eragrostis curvula]|uniref:Uncharacterized protein n=1 Tax=Eragrostis curvula TaxID=38414 RepID=A0A5J9TA19_9POAL|nr:hypothetical protein EJB05_41483 [Eragrostis curvula]
MADPPYYYIAACVPRAVLPARARSPSTTRPNAPNDLLLLARTLESAALLRPLLLAKAFGSAAQTQDMMSSSSSSSSAAAGYALAATAMALSGTLVLFSFCRAKPLHPDDAAAATEAPRLRPCLSSSEKRKREKARRGSKKRVRFADDVVDNGVAATAPAPARRRVPVESAEPSCGSVAAELRTASMPANREALYRGMLRDRSILRVACSY